MDAISMRQSKFKQKITVNLFHINWFMLRSISKFVSKTAFLPYFYIHENVFP